MPLYGQSKEHFTISGYIREAVSGESLIGVNIYLADHKTGTVTNTYGFYSLTLPAADSVELVASYVGFTPEIVRLSLHKNVDLNIELKANIVLNEVTVTAVHITDSISGFNFIRRRNGEKESGKYLYIMYTTGKIHFYIIMILKR